MKKLTPLSVGLCLLYLGSGIASAQEPTAGPPKVLVI